MAQIETSPADAANLSRFAMKYRPFRVFMIGSMISKVGDWMDLVVLNWVVLQMTDSPFMLGVINACRLLPTFLLSVPSGLLADRYDRRKLLIGLQGGIMVFTLGLGFLIAMDSPLWLFIAVVTMRSVLQAMDPPIRNTLIPNLVPKESMANAISLNVAVFNLSRIIGPAIAGSLLAVMDASQLFWINGWSTLAVIFSLWVIRDKHGKNNATLEKTKTGLPEALHFVKTHPSVQSLLLLAVVPMVFGFPYTSLMPLFARDLQRLGPEGLGALLSVAAVGALSGSIWLSWGKLKGYAGRWLICSVLAFGCSLLLFMAARSFVPAAIAIFAVGLTSQTYRTMSRITLQQLVPDELRGRILSIALMDRGFIPLGAMLIGALAETAGVLPAGLAMGGGCILITLVVLLGRREIWNL